jgi:hypothetical protein
VRLGGILQVRCTGGNVGAGDDQRGPVIFLGPLQGGVDFRQVLTLHPLHVPAVGEKAGRHLLAEGEIGLSFDGDAIVEVEVDQVP